MNDKEEYKGFMIYIAPDEYIDSPTDWGNYEIVTFFRNRYITDTDIEEYYTDNGKLKPQYQAKMRAGKLFPIDVYEHGGTAYSLSGEGMQCRWDTSSNAGLIIFNDDYIKGVSYEKRKEYARQDLQEYTMWANGDVYGYSIEDKDGNEIDSLGGCYGYDYCLESAQEYIDDLIQNGVHDKLSTEAYIQELTA